VNIVQNLTAIELSEQDCLLVQGGNMPLVNDWSSLESSPGNLSDRVEKPDLNRAITRVNTQP
jgi:hypothetical protein